MSKAYKCDICGELFSGDPFNTFYIRIPQLSPSRANYKGEKAVIVINIWDSRPEICKACAITIINQITK